MEDGTLFRIKQAEESAKKNLEEAEKKKTCLIEEAKSKSISLISEAQIQDSNFREKEIQKAKEKIAKMKEKLLKENQLSIDLMKKKAEKKLKSEPKFVVKKFSEEVFSD